MNLEQYRLAHSRCPRCWSRQIDATCIGTILPPGESLPEDYRDPNTAWCRGGAGCRWSGPVHDLVAGVKMEDFFPATPEKE